MSYAACDRQQLSSTPGTVGGQRLWLMGLNVAMPDVVASSYVIRLILSVAAMSCAYVVGMSYKLPLV